ncbi:hypothetical protein ACFRMQ_11145 [Kitasatospora sp. NPDC056783]|uniref:hypothetical protein n=1 Tax=Kitasatospora sp. NPDC056783 TaxID=3345943 RepID=UPI0036B8EAAC
MTLTDPVIPAADDEMDEPLPNPFPGADRSTWTRAFSEALALETGLPLEIADAIAPYIVRPKTYLVKPRGEDVYRLRPGFIKPDSQTGLRVLGVTAHGFAGAHVEYNERHRSAFDSPLHPDPDPARMLPLLVTGTGPDGTPLPYVTTSEPVPAGTLSNLIGITEKALKDDGNSDRGYSLRDDLKIYGQNQSTLHVPLLRTIVQSHDGATVIRRVTVLAAIKGANRSRARLALHGLTAKDVAFGIDRSLLNLRDPELQPPLIADPATWVPAYATGLREAYDDPGHRLHQIAQNAARVATVHLEIIVGTDRPEEFHNRVFDPNRADHRRPPLDYSISEKSGADMRAVLRDASSNGLISEEERAWLAAEAPIPASVGDGIGVVDTRDLRDRRLLGLTFPADPAHDRAVARVLGEPEQRADSRAEHVRHRLRMVSAAISDGYRHRWNPRVLDGQLLNGFIRNRGSMADLPSWQSALVDAFTGPEALKSFLITRGIHWLAEHQIIDADRGSVGAQADRIRRSAVDARKALMLQPARAVRLMFELARSSESGTPPRQVDADGQAVDGTVADRLWFDAEFPKVPRPRKSEGRVSETDDTEPTQPDPTPHEVLLAARAEFLRTVTDSLPHTVLKVLDAARKVITAGHAAGQDALKDASEDETRALQQALNYAMQDLRNLQSTITGMQFGGATLMDSATEQFLAKEGAGAS